MLDLDRDALVCDMAQYYKIYEIDKLAFDRLAVFACGLPRDSRIFKKISGQNVDLDSLILAGIFDRLNLLLFSFTGKKGSEAPESMADKLMGKAKPKKDQGLYASGEEFERRKKELIRRMEGENG